MLRAIMTSFATVLLLVGGAVAADQAGETTGEEASKQTNEAADSAQTSPLKKAQSAAKGSLKNPYQTDNTEIVEEGKEIYMAAGCNGCHGGTGGGGMGPPLTNPVWIYGNDGDTLFRVIALGTEGMEEQGYTRTGTEHVQGPMPPQGTIVKSTDDMWKMITWIHAINE